MRRLENSLCGKPLPFYPFLPLDVLDEIWDVIESVSEGFLPTLGSSKTSLSPKPPPSNLLLTVPRLYFCCGSSMLHVMSECIWSSAIWSIE